MSTLSLIEQYRGWKSAGARLAMATVFETAGSTYTKPGHRVLIAENGDYHGLVSGGCLEGDLATHARDVISGDSCREVSYDMRGEEDILWGMGIGCDGLLRVLLQPLTPERDYQPFEALSRALLGTATVRSATIVRGGGGESAGAMLLLGATEDGDWSSGLGKTAQQELARLLRADENGLRQLAGGALALLDRRCPVPRLLVLGAGPDARPLVRYAATLGWRVTVADHRPAYIEAGGFEDAEARLVLVPAELGQRVSLADFDAIVVMSHHLATDRTYLTRIATAPALYLGLLGPSARRLRLLEELGAEVGDLRTRLRGPVGLDIGSDTPESIALSIVAEMQAVLSHRSGRSLSPPAGS